MAIFNSYVSLPEGKHLKHDPGLRFWAALLFRSGGLEGHAAVPTGDHLNAAWRSQDFATDGDFYGFSLIFHDFL